MGTTIRTLKIGAGGFLTGLDIAPDGTKVVRTDTYGAYWLNGSTWQQLVTSNSIPVADQTFAAGDGAYEICISPSNTQRFYMYIFGYVYISNNRGTTWTRTTFSNVAAGGNDQQAGRTFGRHMAVDPQNADILYVGTPASGLFVTLDAGVSFSQVSAVGTASGGGQGKGYAIAFDPTSGVVGGKKQVIYVCTYNTGVYRTTDGGTNWTLLNTAGMPTTYQHMVVGPDGTPWIVDDTGPSVLRRSAGAWSTISTIGSTQLHSIAVDPADANKIVVGEFGGFLRISLDFGANWFSTTQAIVSPSDIPWFANSDEAAFMSNGDQQYDSNTGLLWFAEGIGVFNTTPRTSTGQQNWTSVSAGIEQLVATDIISPPGGNPILCAWDRPLWLVTDPNTYPSTYGPSPMTFYNPSWSADFVGGTPTTIVQILDFGSTNHSGKSTNGGVSWTDFTGAPSTVSGGAGSGGAIAAVSTASYIWVTGDTGVGNPYLTTNNGSTWAIMSAPGVASGDGWSQDYFLRRQVVTADKTVANTAYLYNCSNNGTAAGVYKFTGGTSLAQIHIGHFDVGDGSLSASNAKMKCVPGQTGHLFYSSGQVTPGPWPHSTINFNRSTDGGVNWTTVANVKEVWAFGFGKEAPNQSYPAIYIYGWVNSVPGLWRSDDNAVNWVQLSGAYPNNNLDQVVTIEGDINTYGTVYIGFAGSGWAFGSLDVSTGGFFVKTSGASSPRVLLFVRP